MLATAAIVTGVVAVLLALLPLSSATQVTGLLLGAGAAVGGYLLRKQQVSRGEPTTAATIAIASGVVALVLGGLVFISCQTCPGDGEVDPPVEQQFHRSLKKALDQAREKVEGK